MDTTEELSTDVWYLVKLTKFADIIEQKKQFIDLTCTYSIAAVYCYTDAILLAILLIYNENSAVKESNVAAVAWLPHPGCH